MKLSFRKKRISRETKRRILVLLPIFFLSFILFTVLFNVEGDSFSSNPVKRASLPTVSIDSQGEVYGEFFGYKTSLNLGRVRNGLIPLDADRKVVYHIDTYGNEIDSISYGIYTGDGKRDIAAGPVEDYEKQGDRINAQLTLSNLMDEGEEYMMTIKLDTNGETLHYYMRIKYVEEGKERECLEFAKYFRETALSDNYGQLATYMEPKSTGKGISTAKVTINSSLNDVRWKDFDIQSATEPTVEFAEIDSNYTALELNYAVTGNPTTNPGTFLVNEYYRMRKGEERIFLLDFERTVTQIFNDKIARFEDNKLILGQNGEDIDFISNRTGTNIAFVWQGELYEYNKAASELSRVFFFETGNINDGRTIHNEYDIDILSIDENGNLYYVVYGYMNAGDHEGMCGIGLYHYDPLDDISTEQTFIATDYSYPALKAGFNNDIFLSGDEYVYVGIEGELFRCSILDGSIETLVSGVEGSAYAMSESRRYLAYSPDNAGQITVMDLLTEESFIINAPQGQRIRVVGFIGEDLTYGIIDSADYSPENIADNLYPMQTLLVCDISSLKADVLKTYEKTGKYITRVTKESTYSMSIELSTKNGEIYSFDSRDTLQNTMGLEQEMAYVSMEMIDSKAYNVVEFVNESEEKRVSVTVNNFNKNDMSYFSGTEDILINAPTENNYYYSYRGMDVVSSGGFLSAIIPDAYENTGYCVDNSGNYVWQYGRGTTRNEINLDKYTKEDKIRINLTGCSVSEILPYVYRGNPVYANEGTENEICIIAYDTNYITLKKTTEEGKQRIPINEATEIISRRGNKFSVYI